jgi:putative NADH-flavin reductase
MRIAVIGASGWLGGTVAREALARGHEVTAIGRDATRLQAIEGAQPATADVTDPGSLQRVLAGHDIVVSAVTDRSTADRSIIPRTARTLLEVLPAAGVRRLAVVGGGGSLEEEPGERVVDRPDFPEAYKAEALAQAAALNVYREAENAVDWTYLSPPPHHLIPGEKRGGYRVAGGDAPVVDRDGDSRITAGDFAAALLDEIERPQFTRQRFTAAY